MIATMMIDYQIMTEMNREWNCAMVGDYRQPAIEIMRRVHFLFLLLKLIGNKYGKSHIKKMKVEMKLKFFLCSKLTPAYHHQSSRENRAEHHLAARVLARGDWDY